MQKHQAPPPIILASNYTTNITTTTNYISGFIYESKSYSNASLASLQYTDVLQFTSHEEGRIRRKTDGSFAYDYFLKDHLGNVRMVLTEEQQTDIYPAATLETSKLATEQNYYNINTGQIVDNSTVTGLPVYQNNNVIPNPPVNATFDNANSAKIYKLNKNTQNMGLGITLRVMSGDKLDVFGKSYYFQNNTGGTTANTDLTTLNILTGLLGGPTGAATNVHGAVTSTQLNAIGATTTPMTSMLSSQTTTNNLTPLKPKAFINYILFDDQFKCVGSGFAPVGDNGGLTDYASAAALHNIAVNKNGFVYIYCSNESPVDVFFDNLQVVQTRGPILEETHYYPFGLTMAGISDKAAGSLENKKKFIGQQLDDDLGLNWYQFRFRNHDPQIGRFIEIDPLADKYPYNSTYAYAENKLGKGFDLEGLELQGFNRMFNFAGINVDQANRSTQAKWSEIQQKAEPYVRVTKDVITIAGGVTLLVATGGTGAPLLVGLAGSATVTGGTMKLVFDIRGNKDAADQIPTTLSGTAIFMANGASEAATGKKLVSDDIKTVSEISEGILTLKVTGFGKMNDLEKVSNVLAGLSVTLDAANPETAKSFQNLLIKTTVEPPKVDNTYIAPLPPLKVPLNPTSK